MVAVCDVTAAEPRPVQAEVLEPGAELGRYRLDCVVGSGGMGVVWAAYDPDLDREVAIKILHSTDDVTARARLLREARAMARLAHPNVVSVYEVGTERNRDFVVMELVAGESLAAWLATRPARERVLDALLAAGRGLAAAHAAGLVHRDFKPYNVLRSGAGCVLVTDFGLARDPFAEPEPASASRRQISGGIDSALGSRAFALASPLTDAGALVGTPAYMAPEQLAGAPCTSASDQFAYCVTAWQALTGTRPFGGDDVCSRLDAIEARLMIGARMVPRGVRSILARGLAFDPAARWPDLDALLHALQRTRRRRARAIAVAATMVAAGALATFGAMRSQRVDTCSGGAAAFATAWNDASRSAAHAAFAAVRAPYAPFAWQQADQALERYGHAWSAMRDETCRATERGEQSSAALDVRMSCLAQRLADVRAAGDVLAHADADVVAHAASITDGIGALDGCANLAALQATTPPPNFAVASVVAGLRAESAHVHAVANAGQPRAALPFARDIAARARAIGYAPLLAEVLEQTAELEVRLGDASAEHTLEDAFAAAETADDAHDAVRAASQLAMYVGVTRSRVPDGERWARIAEAESHRRASSERDRADVAAANAAVAVTAGRYPDALAAARSALAIDESLHDELGTARSHRTLGKNLVALGRIAEALPQLEAALAIEQRVYGPVHPRVADTLAVIAQAQGEGGDLTASVATARRALAIVEATLGPQTSEAADLHFQLGIATDSEDELRRAIAIAEKVDGPDHPITAGDRVALATLWLNRERFADAAVELRGALAVDEKALPPGHPETARVRAELGQALTGLGKLDEALVELRAARASAVTAEGAESVFVGGIDGFIGNALLTQGKLIDAVREFDAALAIQEHALGANHPDVAITLLLLGQTNVTLHRNRDAIAQLTRAIAIFEATGRDQRDLADARSALARARAR